jgi:hypothetical protein
LLAASQDGRSMVVRDSSSKALRPSEPAVGGGSFRRVELSGSRGAGAAPGVLLGQGGSLLAAMLRARAGGGLDGEAERPAGPPPDACAEAGPCRPLAARGGALQRPVSLVWLRRDLRLDDNPALTAALKTGGNVVRAAARGRVASRSTTRQAATLRLACFGAVGCLLSHAATPPGGRLHLVSRGGRPVPAGPLQPLVAAQQPQGAVRLAPEAGLSPGSALRTPGARPARTRRRPAPRDRRRRRASHCLAAPLVQPAERCRKSTGHPKSAFALPPALRRLRSRWPRLAAAAGAARGATDRRHPHWAPRRPVRRSKGPSRLRRATQP